MTSVLLEYFRVYNIFFLSVCVILQCSGIPTGGTFLVIGSGAFAYAGEFNIIKLFIEVWIFSFLGDNLSYVVWRIIENKFSFKFGRLKRRIKPKIESANTYLDKYGKATVFFSRFLIPGMGPFVNAAAGITGYNLKGFMKYAALGEIFWVAIYLGLGYWFGDSWETIIPVVTQFGQLITLIIILIVIMYLIIKIIGRGKRA